MAARIAALSFPSSTRPFKLFLAWCINFLILSSAASPSSRNFFVHVVLLSCLHCPKHCTHAVSVGCFKEGMREPSFSELNDSGFTSLDQFLVDTKINGHI